MRNISTVIARDFIFVYFCPFRMAKVFDQVEPFGVFGVIGPFGVGA